MRDRRLISKLFYGIFCVLGIILPYWQFIPWLLEKKLNLVLLLNEAVQTRISAFAWLDVIVSAVVLLGFVWIEGNRLKMAKLWLPILGTLSVGVSFGLPLFLLLREIHLEKESSINHLKITQT